MAVCFNIFARGKSATRGKGRMGQPLRRFKSPVAFEFGQGLHGMEEGWIACFCVRAMHRSIDPSHPKVDRYTPPNTRQQRLLCRRASSHIVVYL